MTAERATSAAQTSTAGLVGDVTAQVSRLVHDELALAKLEMQTKAKGMGAAGAMLATALVLARTGLLLAWALVVVALANVWPLWLAVAVPMAGAFAVAGVLALVGRQRLAQATPPVPVETSESIRTDLHVAQDAIQEGRQS